VTGIKGQFPASCGSHGMRAAGQFK